MFTIGYFKNFSMYAQLEKLSPRQQKIFLETFKKLCDKDPAWKEVNAELKKVEELINNNAKLQNKRKNLSEAEKLKKKLEIEANKQRREENRKHFVKLFEEDKLRREIQLKHQAQQQQNQATLLTVHSKPLKKDDKKFQPAQALKERVVIKQLVKKVQRNCKSPQKHTSRQDAREPQKVIRMSRFEFYQKQKEIDDENKLASASVKKSLRLKQKAQISKIAHSSENHKNLQPLIVFIEKEKEAMTKEEFLFDFGLVKK